MLRGGNRSVGRTGAQPGSIPRCFDISPFQSLRCRVHPVVVFTILDAYIRRDEEQQNVIGTLLGTVSEGNVVDITDCFVDRHSLTGEGLLQIIKDHHETMYELKQQVNGGTSCAREVVVGWFCTGSEMTELTCAVHGWFKQFNSVSKFFPQPPLVDPIHLLVDAAMEKGSLSIKAYMQVTMTMGKEACFQFHEIPLEVFTTASDRTGLSLLRKVREANKAKDIKALDNNSSLISNTSKEGLDYALERLLEHLQKCAAYVKNVIDGKEKADNDVGRFLSKALCVEAAQELEAFESLCLGTLQDNIMVSHLTSLAKLQFAIVEKLNTSFF